MRHVADDDNKHQRPLLVWPPKLCEGGPVICTVLFALQCDLGKLAFNALFRISVPQWKKYCAPISL